MINWGDILVLAVLGLIVGAVIGKMIRDKKKGKCCGCGSCSGCAMAGSCGSRSEGSACSCGCGGTRK